MLFGISRNEIKKKKRKKTRGLKRRYRTRDKADIKLIKLSFLFSPGSRDRYQCFCPAAKTDSKYPFDRLVPIWKFFPCARRRLVGGVGNGSVEKKKRSLFHCDDSLSRLYRVPGFLYERSNKSVELTCVQFSFEQWIGFLIFFPFHFSLFSFFLFVICRLTDIDNRCGQ